MEAISEYFFIGNLKEIILNLFNSARAILKERLHLHISQKKS